MALPLIGRLFWREYVAILASFILILFESLIAIITLLLPSPIIRACYNGSKRLFNSFSSNKGRQARSKKKSIVTSIAQAHDFVDMCALYGYYAEEHVVQTTDGYLLGLHRLGWRKGEEGTRVNGPGGVQKKVIYMHHGLLMNSEVWVCLTEHERCLPFALVEKGYDVWLGNNRGNKYSKKSTKYPPNTNAFWNFSMDEFAFHDIPDSIDYVLETTGQSSLSYIGFSQGTAQAFAALSIYPTLNDKVDVFIALAPAMSPAGLSNGVVDALVKTSPELIFLAFGRRSLLSSATMWQQILYPPIFTRLIDLSLTFLFNWRGRNISPHQKLAAYPHLYSFTSTKSVVHWFQIIRTKCFQMYDDEAQARFSIAASERYYKVAKFPTRNIKTPIVLVYGGSDSLVDIRVMLKELPRHTIAKEIPHFEHLDFLWAQHVETLVFPHVFAALEENAGRDHLATLKYFHRRNGNLGGSISDITDDDEQSSLATDGDGPRSPLPVRKRLDNTNSSHHHRQQQHDSQQSHHRRNPRSPGLYQTPPPTAYTDPDSTLLQTPLSLSMGQQHDQQQQQQQEQSPPSEYSISALPPPTTTNNPAALQSPLLKQSNAKTKRQASSPSLREGKEEDYSGANANANSKSKSKSKAKKVGQGGITLGAGKATLGTPIGPVVAATVRTSSPGSSS